MYEDTKVSQLVINQLSEEKFKELLENDELDPNQLYCTDDRAGYTPPLLSTLWSDHLLNDISWLRADTFSWQSGDVYVAAYNHLVADFEGTVAETTTIDGIEITYYLADDKHIICLPDQEDKLLELYNKTGVAWYYILDTENKQFKLPRTKWGFTGLRDSVGGYVEEGLPDITGTFACGYLGRTNTAPEVTGAFYKYSNYSTGAGDSSGSGLKVYFAASSSNSIYGNSSTVQPKSTQMYLYFYVGCFDKEGLEQTAGLNAELFNQKMDNGTPLIRDIFSPDEWENNSMEQILSAGIGSGDLVFTKNWQEYDYLWFSSVADSSNALDDSPHWLNVKWMLSQAKAGVTNLAVVRYSSGAYWYVNPQAWTETTMPEGSGNESLWINKVYGIKLKNITAKNVGLLNYKGLFETASALVATVPTAMGEWAIVSNDETQGGLQTKYFSTQDVSGNFVWAFGGIIDSSLVGCDYVVESQLPTEANGYTWYRKYKSGWVEQGGSFGEAYTSYTTKTITLPIEMTDTKYSVCLTNATTGDSYAPIINSKTVTTFVAYRTRNYQGLGTWQVSGMSA